MTSSNQTSSQNSTVSRTKKRTFREVITHNWQQKLISLFCALVLFVVVFYDRNMTVNFEKIPVTFKLPDGYVTVDGSKETTVDIKVYGRASQLHEISRDDLGVITLPLPARSGNVQVTLQNAKISLPDGVRIEKFTPEFVGLNLEPISHRTVAVSTEHAFTGELLPGFQVGEVRIVPSEIEISGPKSVIETVSQLYIDPIDLTGKVATFTVKSWISKNRPGIEAKLEQVEVTVNIVSKTQQHVFHGVHIEPINLKNDYQYEFVPSTIDLTLTGEEASLSKLDASKILVTVDVTQDDINGTHSRFLEPSELIISNLPEGVEFDGNKLPKIMLKVGQIEDGEWSAE